MGVLCGLGAGGHTEQLKPREDGPWNAPQQLLLLTNRNMRTREGDLECKEWHIEEAAACFVI